MYIVTKQLQTLPNNLLYLSDERKTLSKFTLSEHKAKRFKRKIISKLYAAYYGGVSKPLAKTC